MIQFGIDRLLSDRKLLGELEGKRVALLAHPASMTADFQHSLDALRAVRGLNITAAFGPQHGLRGDKQDNMVESDDFRDPVHGIPVFSLYGTVRRPTEEMLGHFDVLLVDLQDVGCRIYTFITTLLYVLEAAAQTGKTVWVLDRPNPAGRVVEGLSLRKGWESFVGAGPMPMRHGLTLGELGIWFVSHFHLAVDYRVIPMKGWQPEEAPGYGWPIIERGWVNPSPNAASLAMARAYAGTVMLEGTTLSEGRGTTRPLELLGAPGLDPRSLLTMLNRIVPNWLEGCRLRPLWFEPTFHKYQGKLCSGFQIHVDDNAYEHGKFRPWRLIAGTFKCIRRLRGEYPLWRDFPYEYEHNRLAIDLINGSDLLRQWVDDPSAVPADLEKITSRDEAAWEEQRADILIYR
jgi:uncharacterized protein YbbC (DUF1343 family)